MKAQIPKKNIPIEKSNLQDNRFGSQLLGDFARFIFNALSAEEAAFVKQAQAFITLFDHLFQKSKQELSGDQLMQWNREAFRDVQNFRRYILQILTEVILNKITIHLDPDQLNMMVNTTELLLDGLHAYMHQRYPDTSSLTSKWLHNIYSTALCIERRLGEVYYEEKAQAATFAAIFLKLYNKSVFFDGLRRTGLENFPALDQFYSQIRKNMILYAEFLVDLIDMISKKQSIGMLSLLYVDSIYRRACFFTIKLSFISNIQAPVCDPASPRREQSAF